MFLPFGEKSKLLPDCSNFNVWKFNEPSALRRTIPQSGSEIYVLSLTPWRYISFCFMEQINLRFNRISTTMSK